MSDVTTLVLIGLAGATLSVSTHHLSFWVERRSAALHGWVGLWAGAAFLQQVARVAHYAATEEAGAVLALKLSMAAIVLCGAVAPYAVHSLAGPPGTPRGLRWLLPVHVLLIALVLGTDLIFASRNGLVKRTPLNAYREPDLSFVLDTTEVPLAVLDACVAEQACQKREARGGLDHPAVGLGIADAEALCGFRGGRVPTEAQWLRAHGESSFPWGNDTPTCDRAVALGCSDTLMVVGSGRQGESPFGAVDMAGNAWEWVKGVEGPLLMGGDMTSTPKSLGRNGRKAVPEGSRPALAGVRCAYPAGGGPHTP